MQPLFQSLGIVFISDDGNEEAFERNFKIMPDFFALPYRDRERKMELKKTIGINGIPHLWVLSAKSGHTIYPDGGDQLAGELPRELYQKWLLHLALGADNL